MSLEFLSDQYAGNARPVRDLALITALHSQLTTFVVHSV